jgi:molybdenum cofactor biosynthesis protein MoaC
MGKAGDARMADISGKTESARRAVAEGWAILSADAWRMIRDGKIPKGDVLGVARVAGILAAKDTPRLLPLCHPIPLASVKVDLSLPEERMVRVEAEVKTVAPTGVEMEALAAVAAAALCVYDMCKPVDKGIEITGIRLLEKSGGKSGDYSAPARGSAAASRPASRSASARASAGKGAAPKRSR